MVPGTKRNCIKLIQRLGMLREWMFTEFLCQVRHFQADSAKPYTPQISVCYINALDLFHSYQYVFWLTLQNKFSYKKRIFTEVRGWDKQFTEGSFCWKLAGRLWMWKGKVHLCIQQIINNGNSLVLALLMK